MRFCSFSYGKYILPTRRSIAMLDISGTNEQSDSHLKGVRFAPPLAGDGGQSTFETSLVAFEFCVSRRVGRDSQVATWAGRAGMPHCSGRIVAWLLHQPLGFFFSLVHSFLAFLILATFQQTSQKSVLKMPKPQVCMSGISGHLVYVPTYIPSQLIPIWVR